MKRTRILLVSAVLLALALTVIIYGHLAASSKSPPGSGTAVQAPGRDADVPSAGNAAKATLPMPTAGASTSAVAFGALTLTPSNATPRQAALKNLPRTEQESLWAAFGAARRAVTPLTSHEASLPRNAGVRFFAANPGQHLTARFLDGAVRIESGRGADWQGSLRLAGTPGATGAVPPPVAKENRVEYQHPSGVTEWYENRAEGIEHGFIVAQRPEAAAQAGELRVDVQLDGLTTRAASDDTGAPRTIAVEFLNPDSGRPVVSYGKLKVWDATGRELAARLEARGASVAILVADVGATYPVTIDPLIVSEEAKLLPEFGDGAASDNFGSDVAISGETIVIGVPRDDTTAGPDAGSVYVFVRSGTIWSFQRKLLASDGAADDRFGAGVAISGDSLIAGAWGHDHPTAGSNAGAAYVFVRAGTNWSLQQKLTAGTPESNAEFGFGVGISGDTAVVGAGFGNSYRGVDTGVAYAFARSGTAWTQQAVFTGGDVNPDDRFATRVAISGDTILAGAHGHDLTGVASQGATYVFTRTGTAWNQQQKLTALDATANDDFGRAVALDGDTALVGAYLDDIGTATDAGSTYVFVRSGTTWTQQQKLTHPLPSSGDRFGLSVAVAGGTALVGAYLDDSGGLSDHGNAYAFVRSGTTWSLQAELGASDRAANDWFASSVAISGDTALVGAVLNDHSAGTDAGSATILVRSGGIWAQQAFFTAGDAVSDDYFGGAVAISGDTALIGVSYDDTAAGTNAGSAYVFVRNGTNWIQQAKLTASDGAAEEQFGNAVTLSGNTAVMGAFYDATGAGAYAGSAYVFVRSGTTWSQQAKLTPNDPAAGDAFGVSVSFESNTLVVGSYGDDTAAGGIDAGSAYVFVRSGTTWSQQAKLTASDAAAGDLFGNGVDISADTAVVGAWQDDTVAGTNAGSAYVFVRSGTSWSQQSKLTASAVAAFDYFGVSVAVSSNTVVVGAYGDDTAAGTDAGSAYVFVRNSNTWSSEARLTPADAAGADFFGNSVDIADDTAVIGAYYDNLPSRTDAGSAYVFTRIGTTWSQQTKLTARDAAAGELFGVSVALSGDAVLVGAFADWNGTVAHGSANVFRLSIQPVLRPVFLASPNPVACGQTVTFAQGSSNDAPTVALTNFQYNFGDGSPVFNTTNPAAAIGHAYSQFGAFTTSLTVRDSTGAVVTTNTVINVNQGNRPPVANPGGPYAMAVGTVVPLNGSGSLDPDAACGDSIVAASWDFDASNGIGVDSTLLSPTIPAGLFGGPGTYTLTLRVTDEFGSNGTATTILTLGFPPSIIVQPQSQTNAVGLPVSFSVTATGTPPISYQWRRNGTNLTDGGGLSGAATSALTVESVAEADAGNYEVVVSGYSQSVTSQIAALTVLGKPVIVTQPQGQSTLLGGGVSFSAAAVGYSPLNYQWRRSGTNLAGAVIANLSFASASAGDAGNYDVVVTNIYGRATSQVAVLTVSVPGFAVRELPTTYHPGDTVAVRLNVAPPPGTTNWTVFEHFPANWDVASAPQASFTNDLTGELRFGPFNDSQPRTFTYQVLSVFEREDTVTFNGSLNINNASTAISIGGDTNLVGRTEWEFVGPQVMPGGGFYVSGTAYGAGRWVATSWGWSTTSEDGRHWTYPKGERQHDNGWSRMAFLGGRFLWWGVGGGHTPRLAAAEDGLSWRVGRGSPLAEDFQELPDRGRVTSVTFGNGLYVAVGSHRKVPNESYAQGAIWTSTNGYHWTRTHRLQLNSLLNPSSSPQFPNVSITLNAVGFGDGQFIAVGDRGMAVTSTNGWDWSQMQPVTNPGDTNDPVLQMSLSGVCHGPQGWIVTVGGGDAGQARQVLRSTNGLNWVRNQATTPLNGHDLFNSFYADGRYWFSDSSSQGYWTENGSAWQRVTNVSGGSVSSISRASNGVSPRYLGGSIEGQIFASEDGTNWNQVVQPSGIWSRYLTTAAQGTHWILSGQNQGRNSSWQAPVDRGPASHWIPSLNENDLKVADADMRWREGSSATLADYVEGPAGLIAIGARGDSSAVNRLMVGRLAGTNYTFEAGSDLTANTLFRSVANVQYPPYAPSNPPYVGIGWEWVKATIAATPAGFDAYAEYGQYYDSISPQKIHWGHFTSTNGTHWTRRTPGLNHATNFPGVRGLAYGAGRFVAVSEGSSPGATTNLTSPERLYTSLDGQNYSAVPLAGFSPALTEGLTGLAFAEGAFIAVGNQGRILRSTNGLSWETVRASDGQGWNRVRRLGSRWAVVGNAGRTAFSSNGSAWTSHQTGVPNNLNDIALNDGTYLVVGNNAMVLRSTFRAQGPPMILPETVGRSESGSFHFTVQTEPNSLPMIEVSDNLADWAIISLPHSPPNATGRITFTNSTTTKTQQFFRARMP